MTLANEYWFNSSDAGFYPVTIDQSYRIQSSNLSRTPSSDGNRRTFTISVWVKRTALGGLDIFSSGSNSYNQLSWTLRFTTSDNLYVYASLAGISNDVVIVSKATFRDMTNWYHFVVAYDSTQSTSTNRVKLYANGTQLEIDTGATNHNYGNQNYDTSVNDATYIQRIGRFALVDANQFSGYMAEFNLIDGTALTPSSFGETKNGVWIPKEISGLSYGTNGFRFTFADSSNLGDDTSGNGNDYTSNGLSSTDVVPDSPTNNFAVLNGLEPSGATLTEGNLRFTGKTGVGAGYYAIRATFGMTTGKWYFEGLATDDDSAVGIGTSLASLDNYLGSDAYGYNYAGFNGQKYNNGSGSSYGATFGNGDIIGVAFDADNGTLIFYKNGASQGTAFTSLSATPYFPMVGETAQSSPITTHLNFGQDSSFAGNKTAQGNADENGMGDFYYSPPTGYLALCSSNLPDTTLSPNKNEKADDNFNTVLYTGDGNSSKAITGVGFQPDWVWIKGNGAYKHGLHDSSRIISGNEEVWYTDQSEIANTGGAYLSSFDSDGYTLNANTSGNGNGVSFASWNWKIGGTTPTKTYKVVVVSDSGNKYRFRNSTDTATFAQSAVTLDLQEGGTYTFDLSDSSMSGHPFVFSTTSNGTHGGGAEYTTGVTKTGTAGSAGASIAITVAASAPTLYYYCSNHSGMGGQINTNSSNGSTNFDGSILSIAQTNINTGSSIITWVGNQTNGASVGHGLGVIPELVFIKNRDAVQGAPFNVNLSSKYRMGFNASAGDYGDFTYYNGTYTSENIVFNNAHGAWNGNTDKMVAYSFHSVEGYSKLGIYSGNNSTNNAFIFTGFRPQWLMIKNVSTSADFIIRDQLHSGYYTYVGNVIIIGYEPNEDNALSGGTGTSIDFVSNGFKIRNNDTRIGASNTYFFWAIAENPFKLSNAR